MSLASFEKLMTHTLTLIKRARNSAGDFYNVSSETGVKGFVEYGNHLITTDKDEEKKATAIVYFMDDLNIDIEHDYWMIDQTAPQNRPNMEVLKIDPIDDPQTGETHHYEIYVR